MNRITPGSVPSLLREWKRVLPYIQPCYAISNSSTEHTIRSMREHRIPMLCETPAQVRAVNDYTLTIEASRFGNNEYITRGRLSGSATATASPSIPLWVYTKISHEGIDETRKVFEEIWAHKHILKGIVFDIHNFADTARNCILPSLYSYKIGMDYVVRNIARPFEKEYGIYTPYIMMDGRDNITRPDHLYELSKEPMNMDKRGLLMIVDDLFDGHRE